MLCDTYVDGACLVGGWRWWPLVQLRLQHLARQRRRQWTRGSSGRSSSSATPGYTARTSGAAASSTPTVASSWFLGIMITRGAMRVAELQAGSISVHAATSSTIFIVAGWLSFALGLNGLCVSLDTVCTSALIGRAELVLYAAGAADKALIISLEREHVVWANMGHLDAAALVLAMKRPMKRLSPSVDWSVWGALFVRHASSNP